MSAPQSIHPDDLLAHAEALRRLARALLHDEGLAEDVVQQAFLTALEQRPRSPLALGAWLRSIVRHNAIALKLSSERRDRREQAVARTETVPCHVKTAEALALQRDVVEAVSALREPYRTVIYQRYYEDLPPRAIAAKHGAPVKTIKTQLWRGLEMLRARLDGKHGDRRIWAATLLPVARGKLLTPITEAALTAPVGGVFAMKLKTAVVSGVGLVLLAAALFAMAGGQFTQSEPSSRMEPIESLQQSTAHRQRAARAPGGQVHRALVTTPFAKQEAPPVGQLHVQCVWSDETPAAFVQVIVQPMDDLSLLGKQRFVTDLHGRVLASELRPGRFTLLTDRGRTIRTQVRAGEVSEVRIRFGPGVDVNGVVVDAHGHSVAGAHVYLAGSNVDWSVGFPVAQCGSDGRFLLRSLNPEDSLWASAALHGPSEVLDLEQRDVSSGSVDIRLMLSEGGAAVRGRVVDAKGQAVADARIALGVPPPNFAESRVDGSQVEVRVPRIATSDEGGLFAFEGVSPGRQLVVVHADGWPIWRDEVTVDSPGGPPLLVQLERGVIVRGVVRDESDDPVEGAVVLALPAPFASSIPGQGPSDRDRTFPHPGARSGAHGTFELPPVSAGQIHLYASKGERRWRVEDENPSVFLGSAQETVTAYAGQEVVWEPRLSLGRTIEGRVIYDNGAPMQRVFVDARREGGGLSKTATTNALGEFSIHNLTEDSYRVSVVQRGAPPGTAPLYREGVVPDGSALVLRASFSKHDAETGRVNIRFVDDSHRAKSEASVVFANAKNWFRADLSGDVYTATLPHGRYRPVAMAGDVEVGEGAWFDLRSGDNLDLGTLHSVPGGDLLIRVNRGTAPEGDLEIMVHPVDGLPLRTKNSIVLREGLDELRIENLSGGRAKVTLWGDSCLTERLQVDIIPGAVTEASFNLRRGMRRDMEFHAKNAQGAFNLTLRDGSGMVVYEAYRDEGAEPREVLRYSIALPLGRFSVDARTASGLKFKGEVEFKSFEPLARPLRLDLR